MIVQDYQVGSAVQFDQAFHFMPDGCKTSDFRAIAIAFANSMKRINALGLLPLELAFVPSYFTRITDAARVSLGVPVDAGEPPPELIEELGQEAIRLKDVFDQSYLSAGEDAALVYKFTRGVHLLENLIGSGEGKNDLVARGLEALMASMIALAYGAFETMATDLWVAAVNRYTVLAKNFVQRNPDRKIDLNVLAGYSFDTSRSMGTVFLENNRVSFQSLGALKLAYADIFKGASDSAFEPWHAIYLAERIRHVIAHRGGLVDRKFQREMQHYPHYSDVSLDQPVPLSGANVAAHVQACVVCGKQVFRFVDDWAVQQDAAKTE